MLVLIPVFGVYYLVFTWPMNGLNDTASFVMLFIEMFFNSYQVSIAYLNLFLPVFFMESSKSYTGSILFVLL